jgi:hypothetical protein
MKIRDTIAVAIILASLSSTASAEFYSQNFDSMGTAGTTPPAGWSVWILPGSSSSLTIPTSAEVAAATLGTTVPLVVWNQTQAPVEWDTQAGNEGATATDPNRLLGTSPTTSRGTILQFSLDNTSGSALGGVTLSYDVRTTAAGTLKEGSPANSTDELPGYSFYYLDGSTWLHVPSLDLASDGSASAFIPFSTPVANGGTMLFRWFDDNAQAFSPDTMYAIDNVVVIPEPSALSLLTLGALALISRRRKA